MTPSDRQEVDDLKAHVDLVELVRQSGLDLKRKGKNWLCKCPFHDDQTASLSVQGQLWNCFACEAGGDALSWLQLREKLTFPEALARLRDLAGETLIASPEPVGDLLAGGLKRSALLEKVMDHYLRKFRETPAAQQYLNKRGLDSRELWDAFRVGYCDGSLNVPEEGDIRVALTQLGVLNDKGREVFRGCLVIPLSHPQDGLVGLYGRRLDPDAKVQHQYLPGPHRGILNWQSLQLATQVVITESVLDALSFWRAGVANVSCVYGAQGMPRDFGDVLLAAGVREISFCLDTDKAGKEATKRFSVSLSERGFRCHTLELPEAKDPNQLLVERGPGALKMVQKQRQEVPLEKPAEKPRCEMTADGFVARFVNVTYQVWPQPPFSSRLRARIRAKNDHRLVMDVVDFYVSRSRKNITNQLGHQLEIPKVDAERHLIALMEQTEQWVAQRKSQEDSEEAPKTLEITQEERHEAMLFLTQENLVGAILGDMQAMGYVGEDNAKLLGYLIGISRKLEKPLSGIVLSQSGAGKSSLTELVEALTPPEDVVLFSRLSPQALYWMERTALKRKLLILEERVGAIDADYSIRVLQSRAKLTQAVVIKDPQTGKMSTKTFVVEGPIAYLETTTDNRLNHENATRCFEINLDESTEQTRRIQDFQRGSRLASKRDRRKNTEVIKRRHHNAQRLLEPVLSFIPYAELLEFPSKWLRTRRDNERFLCLIEAVAFLHQFQRERGETEDGTDYVMANLDDYRIAYELAKDVLATTLHELSREAKDLFQVVSEWVAENNPSRPAEVIFTRRDLRTVTNLEDHRLRQSLNELVDMEYFELVSGGNGRTHQYRVACSGGGKTPSSMRELTTPEERARRWSPQPCEPCANLAAR